MSKVIASLLILTLAAASLANAQPRADRRAAASVTWTAIGAGAGFGVGLWAGLTAFDDAINSDRKVWTSAIVGAAVGAVGGYFIGRAFGKHDQPAQKPDLGGRHLKIREQTNTLFNADRHLHRVGLLRLLER